MVSVNKGSLGYNLFNTETFVEKGFYLRWRCVCCSQHKQTFHILYEYNEVGNFGVISPN